MTAPELLRAAGWRLGHNPDGSEYWEHDKLRLMRHSLECALTQELDWEQDELAHKRPALRAAFEGQDKLRERRDMYRARAEKAEQLRDQWSDSAAKERQQRVAAEAALAAERSSPVKDAKLPAPDAALEAERVAHAKDASRLAKYDAVARKVRDNGLTFCSRADRKVLKAMAAVPTETLRRTANNQLHSAEQGRGVALAELERRGEAP